MKFEEIFENKGSKLRGNRFCFGLVHCYHMLFQHWSNISSMIRQIRYVTSPCLWARLEIGESKTRYVFGIVKSRRLLCPGYDGTVSPKNLSNRPGLSTPTQAVESTLAEFFSSLSILEVQPSHYSSLSSWIPLQETSGGLRLGPWYRRRHAHEDHRVTV